MKDKSIGMQGEMQTEGLRRALAYRWVVWGVMVFAFIVVFFHRFAAGVVKDDVTKAFGLSSAAFGSMASMYFYAYMIMQIPVGYLADTLGARITVSLGMFAAGIGSILFGFAPTAFWLFAGRFLVGLGVSTVFVCIMKIQSQWFRNREFATLSGATSFVGNAGGILSQGPFAFFLTIVSWRSSFVIIGLFTFLISLLCYRFIRNRPQEMNFPPINEREMLNLDKTRDQFYLVKGLKEILAIKGIIPVSLFFLLNQSGFYALTAAWGVPWLVQVYGLSVADASSYTVMLVGGNMIGGCFIGWISDKVGRRKIPMILCAVFYTFLWCTLLFYGQGMPPLHWLKAIFLFLGITNSSFVLAWSVAKEITPEKYTGLAISVLNAVGFLAIALSTSIIGCIIDALSSLSLAQAYNRALLLPLGTAVLSIVSAWFVPETGGNVSSGRESGGVSAGRETITGGPGEEKKGSF